MPFLASWLTMELDDLLPVVDAAEMLGFAEVGEGASMLTPSVRRSPTPACWPARKSSPAESGRIRPSAGSTRRSDAQRSPGDRPKSASRTGCGSSSTISPRASLPRPSTGPAMRRSPPSTTSCTSRRGALILTACSRGGCWTMETSAFAQFLHPRRTTGPGMEAGGSFSACCEKHVGGSPTPAALAVFRVRALTFGDRQAGDLPIREPHRALRPCRCSRL